jgi:hypothetical protein
LIGELRPTPEARRLDPGAMDSPGLNSVDEALVRRRTLITFSWLFGTAIAIWLFGFFIAIPLVVFLYLKVQSGEGWTLSLVLAGASWLTLVSVFDRVLHLPFPEGSALELVKTFF